METFIFPTETSSVTNKKKVSKCDPCRNCSRVRSTNVALRPIFVGGMFIIAGAVITVVLLISSQPPQEEIWCKGSKESDYKPNVDGSFAFASYYQTHMVLQREPHTSIVWGYGTVGADVNISLFAEEVYTTTVVEGHDGRGVWSVKLHPQPAGSRTCIQGIHDDGGLLQFAHISDILFGDVFVCSGQSNMAMTLNMIDSPRQDLEETANYPDIRVFTVKEDGSPLIRYDFPVVERIWSIPSPENMDGKEFEHFSAICWLYGRYLYNELKIPVGLVASSRGSSSIEQWSPPSVTEECRVSLGIDNKTDEVEREPNFFNTMIHPLLNMTIKGILWYQGETNTYYRTDRYQCMFPNMIKTWRKKWYEGTQMSTEKTLPFGFVQLGGMAERRGNYSVLRWHQTADYGYVPNPEIKNAFMAVAMDLPDPDSPYGSIHPRYKRRVAARLVAGALSTIYSKSTGHEGPFPENLTETIDHKVIIRYSPSQVLAVNDRGNFQICCQGDDCELTDPDVDEKWQTTNILEHNDHTITVDARICSNQYKLVDKVRYAWALNPCSFRQCSVYNEHHFPGSPFILQVYPE